MTSHDAPPRLGGAAPSSDNKHGANVLTCAQAKNPSEHVGASISKMRVVHVLENERTSSYVVRCARSQHRFIYALETAWCMKTKKPCMTIICTRKRILVGKTRKLLKTTTPFNTCIPWQAVIETCHQKLWNTFLHCISMTGAREQRTSSATLDSMAHSVSNGTSGFR